MGRADRAGREDHLTHCIDALDAGLSRELDPHRARALEDHAMHQRVGDDLQVWPPFRWAKISRGGAGAPPSPACLLAPADRISSTARQIVDVGPVFDTEPLRG